MHRSIYHGRRKILLSNRVLNSRNRFQRLVFGVCKRSDETSPAYLPTHPPSPRWMKGLVATVGRRWERSFAPPLSSVPPPVTDADAIRCFGKNLIKVRPPPRHPHPPDLHRRMIYIYIYMPRTRRGRHGPIIREINFSSAPTRACSRRQNSHLTTSHNLMNMVVNDETLRFPAG